MMRAPEGHEGPWAQVQRQRDEAIQANGPWAMIHDGTHTPAPLGHPQDTEYVFRLAFRSRHLRPIPKSSQKSSKAPQNIPNMC